MCVLANFEPFSPFSNFKINTLGAFYTTNVRSLSHKTHKIYIRVLHGHKYGTKYKFSNFYASNNNNETRCGAFLINGRWPQSTITTKIIASTFSIWINTKKSNDRWIMYMSNKNRNVRRKCISSANSIKFSVQIIYSTYFYLEAIKFTEWMSVVLYSVYFSLIPQCILLVKLLYFFLRKISTHIHMSARNCIL